jgi:hypothetical protein
MYTSKALQLEQQTERGAHDPRLKAKMFRSERTATTSNPFAAAFSRHSVSYRSGDNDVSSWSSEMRV